MTWTNLELVMKSKYFRINVSFYPYYLSLPCSRCVWKKKSFLKWPPPSGGINIQNFFSVFSFLIFFLFLQCNIIIENVRWEEIIVYFSKKKTTYHIFWLWEKNQFRDRLLPSTNYKSHLVKFMEKIIFAVLFTNLIIFKIPTDTGE